MVPTAGQSPLNSRKWSKRSQEMRSRGLGGILSGCILAQTISLTLFGGCLSWMISQRIDFRKASVRFGLLRPELYRFLQIVERAGVLPGSLAFSCKCQRSLVEQISRAGVLRIELLCVV